MFEPRLISKLLFMFYLELNGCKLQGFTYMKIFYCLKWRQTTRRSQVWCLQVQILINFTHAWSGVSASAPVDPVVQLRVCLQTEVHGVRGQGSAHGWSGVPGRHWDRRRITSGLALKNHLIFFFNQSLETQRWDVKQHDPVGVNWLLTDCRKMSVKVKGSTEGRMYSDPVLQ